MKIIEFSENKVVERGGRMPAEELFFVPQAKPLSLFATDLLPYWIVNDDDEMMK